MSGEVVGLLYLQPSAIKIFWAEFRTLPNFAAHPTGGVRSALATVCPLTPGPPAAFKWNCVASAYETIVSTLHAGPPPEKGPARIPTASGHVNAGCVRNVSNRSNRSETELPTLKLIPNILATGDA